MLQDQVLPRRIVAIGARAGQRQIGQVQTVQVRLELAGNGHRVLERLCRTRLKRRREPCKVHPPPARGGVAMQSFGKSRGNLRRVHSRVQPLSHTHSLPWGPTRG